ncbi:hypothetical protein [Synechococcus sp. KORDI-100]|uniref:hypothetical protein n=1 Tax=Synechococcus sp. KORDI-100 TaxID=1280380 RepID=UPI0012E053C4|nr:hypothetical protein [Synechococcus sp. KORDI-100]
MTGTDAPPCSDGDSGSTAKHLQTLINEQTEMAIAPSDRSLMAPVFCHERVDNSFKVACRSPWRMGDSTTLESGLLFAGFDAEILTYCRIKKNMQKDVSLKKMIG